MAVETVHLVVGAAHGRLPSRSLVAVAVAQEAVDAIALAVHAGGQRLAQREGEPHAQRAGGHLHARRGAGHGVPLEAAAQLAERRQLLHRQVAALGQDSVEGGGGVPLAQDEAIAVRPGGVGGVVAEDAPVERRQDVRTRERAARVARPGGRRHGDYVASNALGEGFQLLQGSASCQGQGWLVYLPGVSSGLASCDGQARQLIRTVSFCCLRARCGPARLLSTSTRGAAPRAPARGQGARSCPTSAWDHHAMMGP